MFSKIHVRYTQKCPFFAMAEDELAKLMVAWRRFFMPIFHTIMTLSKSTFWVKFLCILLKIPCLPPSMIFPYISRYTYHAFGIFLKVHFYHGVSILGNEGTNSCNKSSAKMVRITIIKGISNGCRAFLSITYH